MVSQSKKTDLKRPCEDGRISSPHLSSALDYSDSDEEGDTSRWLYQPLPSPTLSWALLRYCYRQRSELGRSGLVYSKLNDTKDTPVYCCKNFKTNEVN